MLIFLLAKTGQMKNLLGVFGGAISIGHKMIPSIHLFLTVGEHEYSFLMSAVFDFVLMSLIFYIFGSVVVFCLRERKTTIFLYSLFAVFFMFCLMLSGCDRTEKPDGNTETEIKQTSGAFTYHAYVSSNQKECWIYKIDVNTKKNTDKLGIPEQLNDYKVTRLGAQAPDDEEFYNNIFGITVERAHDVDGYSSELKNIKTMEIPNTVTKISRACFSGMNNLRQITIPDHVTKIEEELFYGCDKLTTVVLPEDLSTINPVAFSDCLSLTNIKISANSKNYKVVDGMLLSKKKNELVFVAGDDKKVVIPEGTKAILYQAFLNSQANEVEIPASVELIEQYALENKKIHSVTVSENSKYFAKSGRCIYDKRNHSLDVGIPDAKGHLRICEKVERMDENYSIAGYSVKTVEFPENLKTVINSGLHVSRIDTLEKATFLGKKPPKVTNDMDGYASLPVFTDVYVPKQSLKRYKKLYEEQYCLDYVDHWYTF